MKRDNHDGPSIYPNSPVGNRPLGGSGRASQLQLDIPSNTDGRYTSEDNKVSRALTDPPTQGGTQYSTSSVPEPGTLVMGAVAAGLIFFRCRK